jgi:serine-type D-Ala-D-Ala carboxypeptidase (penicillin-binding protein 5/6)
VRRTLAIGAAALVLATPASAAPPDVAARAYVVENGATGEVLAALRPRSRLPIASITKLMTVLVALEKARPELHVTVTSVAAGVGESTVDLRPGERVTVRELVEASLIQSANDAAWALAAGVGDRNVSTFVVRMNAKARELGLRDTRFVRPDGLDVPGHVSSARDVTLLARVAMRNPMIRSIVDERSATISGGRRLHTWNDLLGSIPGTIGVKTGHTAAAGWSQVAAVRAPGYILYATLLGSPSRARRNADLAALIRWGLAQYRPVEVVSGTRVYARADVGYGRKPLAVVAATRIVRSVRVGRPLREVVVAPAVARLPVRKNQRVGTVRVYDGERLLAESPLVATRGVERPGFLSRAWSKVRTIFP